MAKRKRLSRSRKRSEASLPPDTLPQSAFSLILGIRYLADQLLQTSPMSRMVLGRRLHAGFGAPTTLPPTTLPPTTLPPPARRRKRKAAARKRRAR